MKTAFVSCVTMCGSLHLQPGLFVSTRKIDMPADFFWPHRMDWSWPEESSARNAAGARSTLFWPFTT